MKYIFYLSTPEELTRGRHFLVAALPNYDATGVVNIYVTSLHATTVTVVSVANQTHYFLEPTQVRAEYNSLP